MRKKYGRKRHPELALNSRKSLKEKKKKKKETLIGEAIQKKKGVQFAREHKDFTRAMGKVMWPDEFRVPLFQSDGCIEVRREADEVMHPSCPVPSMGAEL